MYCVRISHEDGDKVVSWKAVHKFSHFVKLHEHVCIYLLNYKERGDVIRGSNALL